MKVMLAQLGVIAIALLIVAAVIFEFGDRTMLIPSPSVVLEGFLQSIVNHHYSQATTHLSGNLEEHTRPEDLEIMFDSLTARTGEIIDVHGEEDRMHGNEAEATASLRTASAGTITIVLPMQWSNGAWNITSLEGLVHPIAHR